MDKPERVEVEPQPRGQAVPVSEIPAIEKVIELALGHLVSGRVARAEWGGYFAHARLIGTQWRGEIMISVTRKVGA